MKRPVLSFRLHEGFASGSCLQVFQLKLSMDFSSVQ